MDETIEINGSEFVSYELLCNIGNINGYANLEYLKDIYPEIKIVKNGAYNKPEFMISDDVNMFLEKDNMGSEAIWLRVGSKIDDEVSTCLENEPVLSHKHFEKAENKMLDLEATRRYSVLNDMILDMSEKSRDLLDKARMREPDNFDWKKVLSKSVEDLEDFSVKVLKDSSDFSVIIRKDENTQDKFEKEIIKESKELLKNRLSLRM